MPDVRSSSRRLWLVVGLALAMLAVNGPAARAADQPAILAPPDAVVGEGDGTIDLPVRLSAASTDTVTVNFATANSSADASTGCFYDYVGASGTLSFAPGETSKVVHVAILDCNDVEILESFTLNLSNAVNATVARRSTRVSIVDNDTVVVTPRLLVRDAIVDEKDGVAFVPVLMGGPRGQASAGTVTVSFATQDGTASGGDFTPVSGTLTFAPGQSVKTIAVPITDDALAEARERFTLTLSAPSNATIANGTGTITIGASDASPLGQPAISPAADALVGEGDGYLDLVVRLSAPGSAPVAVDYATLNSSASASTGCYYDYIAASGTLNFAPGETTKTVRVEINDCNDVDNLNSFTFNLSNATNSTIARRSQRITIIDNDTIATTPRLLVRDTTVDEKDGDALVSVLLAQASASTITVNFATQDGTAGTGDYTAVNGTLTFAPGQSVKTITIPITDDAAAEPRERFTLTLSAATNATIVNGTGTITIGASDASPVSQPAISTAADALVGEGDGYLDLVVRLSAPGSAPVAVDYATANSSASASTGCYYDYIAANGTLNFAPGETTKTARVEINDCNDVDNLNSFTFNLSNATNATIARRSQRITIIDNDTIATTPRLLVRDTTVDEKDGDALVSVLLAQASASTITVNFATQDGTAGTGDYTAVNGTLTFAPGQSVKTITIPITDDALAEARERFTLTLSAATNATIVNGTGTITIGASDASPLGQPAISPAADALVGEGDGYIDLVVRLSAPGSAPVAVDYATANSSASASTGCYYDYIAASGTLNFAPGETTKTVRVEINDCNDVDNLNSFTFNLSNATNSTIARRSQRITIIDNDTIATTPRLLVRDTTVDEKDGDALVSVLLAQASASTITVNYATQDGTATSSDYTTTSGTLTFAPGQTVKTIAVPISDDTLAEDSESFTLALAAPTNATIAGGTGTITIGASDAVPVAQPAIGAPADVVVDEGDGYIDLVVRLSAPGVAPVAVDYATANGSASASTSCYYDYIAAAGTLNFAPGETTKVVRVEILDCTDVETLESFTLNLSNAVNAVIARATGRIFIAGGATLTSLAVTPANPAINAGAGQQFTATGQFSDGSTQNLTSTVTWTSSTPAIATVTAAGRAQGVAGGTSTITASVVATSDATVLTVNQAQSANPETITFASLPTRTYGEPDFGLSATSSSALPVSYRSSGNCTVTGATVHLTGAGSCTITASRGTAPEVSRTFSIAKAGQTITFATLPNRALGDPDFTLSAGASSGLPVTFTASGKCTVSGAKVHLTGAGACTITAAQSGNANYTAASRVTRTFTVARVSKPKCLVPNLTGKTLAAAKTALTKAHCATGKITLRASRKVKKGRVVSQSRKPKQVLAAGGKVNLVVSRGRR